MYTLVKPILIIFTTQSVPSNGQDRIPHDCRYIQRQLTTQLLLPFGEVLLTLQRRPGLVCETDGYTYAQQWRVS